MLFSFQIYARFSKDLYVISFCYNPVMVRENTLLTLNCLSLFVIKAQNITYLDICSMCFKIICILLLLKCQFRIHGLIILFCFYPYWFFSSCSIHDWEKSIEFPSFYFRVVYFSLKFYKFCFGYLKCHYQAHRYLWL